ncbi:hypothetical protein [Lacticaseibacillus nasuensis]|uniref:Prepilin type IV endopeptidase peptidase domain-containing protein n=1 Tax=Lacticaseibacillus nasuensis JCM 17158 TaxID=1291734 RepID=A0A0R1JIM9_9LACO|nr:hypothetical protein [Lacticaseibacillus nasuensis]KRK71173.1 hypothetical protein FD02_GL000360 [Lacticaseibacillus nasuensis JCM 17158]
MVTLAFFIGLTYFAYADWRLRSVPAWPFTSWCLLIAGLDYLTLHPGWWPVVWTVAFVLFARVTRGLGSADVWLLGVIATRYALLPALWLVLLACGTTFLHAFVRPSATYPFLAHLAFASAVVILI